MEVFDRPGYPALPKQVLSWIEEQAGTQSRVVQVTPLQGGISSAVVALEVYHGENNEQIHWVIRQFTDTNWLQIEPDLALHETAALQAARPTGLPSPEWIAADPDGKRCGLPTVLMSRLPGRVVLPPQAPSLPWLQGLAGIAAKLHASKAEPISWNYFTYNKIERLQIPEWTTKPAAWAKIIECLQGPLPGYAPRLIHRDFHPANVLWQDEHVSGVVDWVNACQGPAGIDTGHCRLNLVQLYGTETADIFLKAYLDSKGSVAEAANPYWDMLCLIEVLPGPPGVYKGWEDLGFRGLNAGLIQSRLDDYAESLAKKARRRDN
ncbi:phosphotransferase family enzyme [Fontibacillus phaseoli]|uniref:Phosphotransferase family enzyme n=1 Tax=Fontibacillus phaseoli TaxID=1416533 RepID=A0A369B6D0_9BACL|nr:aminoglycoside phosphotransferase family protein [Fontibacillus phaseoli]RCX17082.1 phosphotransferase family enzyme [Fontibacillus phaseoli]